MKPFVSNIDLHSHSNASDGALSPEELVDRAIARGLTHLALTDHDTAQGVAAAAAHAEGRGISVIPGAELSTLWNNYQIHIVGLFLNLDSPELESFVAAQKQRRAERARAIGERLERQGFRNAYERCRAQAGEGANITRGNYARFIFSEGKAQSIDDAFNAYLKKGKSAYVKPCWPEIGEAVGTILAAGGVAVLAHPRRYLMTNTKLRALIEDFKSCGGEAMEVASCMQRPCDRAYLCELAGRYGMLGSMGSDFHQNTPWLDLGLSLEMPEGVIPVWEHERAKGLFNTNSIDARNK